MLHLENQVLFSKEKSHARWTKAFLSLALPGLAGKSITPPPEGGCAVILACERMALGDTRNLRRKSRLEAYLKVCLLFVIGISLVSELSCQRSTTLEFSDTSPARDKTAAVLLEQPAGGRKSRLLLRFDNGEKRTSVSAEAISAHLGSRDYETFEMGVCLANIVWPSSDVAVALVANCMGAITFVAYDFEKGMLIDAEPYTGLMLLDLKRRYPFDDKDRGASINSLKVSREVTEVYLRKRAKR